MVKTPIILSQVIIRDNIKENNLYEIYENSTAGKPIKTLSYEEMKHQYPELLSDEEQDRMACLKTLKQSGYIPATKEDEDKIVELMINDVDYTIDNENGHVLDENGKHLANVYFYPKQQLEL
ncbi:hypothetical protein KHQ81_15630 (plasmid) [Mycoplasmatota bacterium]|nr:hypothetical protein KHQ81_15630 [Mycoplasmatota bacterium]